MNAKQFAAELASRTGKEPNSILIFDRNLAEGGLREGARGRHAPDIKCSEAVSLLLAVLSGRPSTQAAKAATDLSSFTMQAHPTDAALSAFHHAFGLENSFEHLAEKNLGDLLVLLCKRIAEGKFGQDNFCYLEVMDGTVAKLQFELNWLPTDRSQRLSLEAELPFTGAVEHVADKSRGNYYESRTVTSSLLGWIGKVAID